MISPILLLVVALADTPVDPTALASAQSSLEAYLSRIGTLHITYEQTSKSPDTGDKPHDPLAARSELPREAVNATSGSSRDLLYAYPSLRLRVIQHRTDAAGNVVEHIRETGFFKGEQTEIDYTHKQFNHVTSKGPIPFSVLPVDPLGLRVMHTLSTPLSDFLKFPGITWFEGDDEIDGERVIRLRIGPGIPESVRPSSWSEQAVIRLALAPERHYLPVRWEISTGVNLTPDNQDLKFMMSIGAFRPVQDVARKSVILFPHRLEIEFYNGGKNTWDVENAIINRKVSEQDFKLVPPPGYFVARNGVPLVLSGGTAQRDHRVRESVEEAKRLLDTIEPARSSQRFLSQYALSIVVGLVSTFVLSLVLLYHWRNRR